MLRAKFNYGGSKRNFSRIKSLLPNSHYMSANLRGKLKAFSATLEEGADIEYIKSELKKIGVTNLKIE